MEQVRVSDLKTGAPLSRPLFHSSGEMLLGAAEVLAPETARMLARAGIEEILRPEPGEDPGEFILRAKNLAMPVENLEIGQRMTQPVFDRSGTLLVEAGAVVSRRIAASLKRRGVHRIYVRKSTKDLRLDQVQAFRRALRRMGATRPAPIRESIDASRLIRAEDCTSRRIDEIIDAGGEVTVPRTGKALAKEVKLHEPLAPRSEASKDGFVYMYEGVLSDTARIFKAFEESREVDEQEIGNLARQVVGGLIEDRDMLLNLQNMKTEYNYLLGHSLGVTVLSVSLATALGYDRKLVLEIGQASYLHDIGMLRVPKEIVSKTGKLTDIEFMQIRRHPIYGLDMLQKLVGRRSGLAGTIPIAAYQSHEREDGSGYPKGRKGRLVHDFAKMVGICDVYEAMTSRRPWRGPTLPYRAMEQLVLMASRRQVPPDMVRALLRYASLFPIGSWVELSDESLARVVAATDGDYTRPVVSVMYRHGEQLEKPERISLTDQQGIGIARPVPDPREGLDLMEGF